MTTEESLELLRETVKDANGIYTNTVTKDNRDLAPLGEYVEKLANALMMRTKDEYIIMSLALPLNDILVAQSLTGRCSSIVEKVSLLTFSKNAAILRGLAKI